MVKDTTLDSSRLVPDQTVPSAPFSQEELAQNPRKYSELDTHAALLQLLNSDNSPYASRRDETGISVDPRLSKQMFSLQVGFPSLIWLSDKTLVNIIHIFVLILYR